MTCGIRGWPAGDPAERFTEREARVERYEQARELRAKVGEFLGRQNETTKGNHDDQRATSTNG